MYGLMNRNKIIFLEAKKAFKAPDPPKTVLEALEQRLEKYKSAESEAKAAGEGSKARRHGRIVKVCMPELKASRDGLKSRRHGRIVKVCMSELKASIEGLKSRRHGRIKNVCMSELKASMEGLKSRRHGRITRFVCFV